MGIFLQADMYSIPQGYIDKAQKAVRDELFSNLRCGGRNTDEYYYTIAAERIWYCYLKRIVEESSATQLSLKDIFYACRKAEIECAMQNGCELTLSMPNSLYWFSDAHFQIYGGPADFIGNYQGYTLEGPDMNLSIKTFLKYLKWFDSIIPSIEGIIPPMVAELCGQYKQAQVAQTSLEPLIEARLNDVPLNYACRPKDASLRIEFWLYTNDVRNVHLSFGFKEFTQNIEIIEKVIRIVYKDPSKYSNYPKWAKMLDFDDEDWRPDINIRKCIGII